MSDGYVAAHLPVPNVPCSNIIGVDFVFHPFQLDRNKVRVKWSSVRVGDIHFQSLLKAIGLVTKLETLKGVNFGALTADNRRIWSLGNHRKVPEDLKRQYLFKQ